MDTGVDIHPLVAWSHRGFDGGSLWGPYPSQKRLEAKAMLIPGPPFDARLGVGVLNHGDLLGPFFYTPTASPRQPSHARDEGRESCS
jgi:hypothetical protein